MDPFDRREVERGHEDIVPTASVQQIHHRVRHALVEIEVRIRRRVLDLDVHQQAHARVEDLGQGRQPPCGLSNPRERCLGKDPKTFERGVVKDDQLSVDGAVDVEFHTVRTVGARQLERLDRVLTRPTRTAAVTKDQRVRNGHHDSVFAHRLQNGRSDPLQRVLARP